MTRRREWTSLFGWSWRAAPRQLLLTAALLVGGALASIGYPVGLAIVINAALHHQADRLVLGIGIVAVLYTVTWAFGMFAGIAAAKLSDLTTFYLTARIAEQLNAVDGVDHLERPAYRTELDILRENTRLLGNGARQMLVLLQVVLRTVGIVVILALIFPPLAVLPLFAIAPVLGERVSVAIRQRTEERLASTRRLADELFELATSAGPAKELRVFGTAVPLRDRHRALAAEVTGEITHATRVGVVFGVLGWLVFAAGFIAGITAIVLRAADGHASVGEVVLAVTLIQRVQLQVGQAAATVGQLLTAARQAQRLLWLEDYASAEDRRAQTGSLAVPPDALNQGITLDGISFAYPPGGARVLSDVSLHVPAGSAIAVVGENGAGKTTLVKLLTGMYQPTAGRILLDGTPLADIDLPAWRARTAAAFQDFVRFELLAREVIGIGDVAQLADDVAIGSALHRADASSVVEELRDALSTPLGPSFERGQELSGGQWQRLALARGMMRTAPLLLVLDEPTASLDAITETALFDRYLAARSAMRANGAITVLVSHRFSTVRMADLIVVLDQGRITECGDHTELMRQDGLYAQLFEMQARAYR